MNYKREEAGFIVLYGRRRVGKTELVNRFIKNKKERTERYGIIARRIGIEDKKDLRSKGYPIYDLEDLEALMKPSDS